MFLSDDVIYHILLWLPVISLLRFKSICRSWCVLMESSDFIKHHLHHHHYDPRLKDKNHNLIYRLPANDLPITFSLTSIDSFEAPNVCLQLDCSDLLGYFPIEVYDVVSFNGIVCLNMYDCNNKQSICLWNPATKQSRFLPQSPFPLEIEMEDHVPIKLVGFGFDVKTNGYKVVNLIISCFPDEKRVEVYDLCMDSWKNITTVFPFDFLSRPPRMPFNNGTCFCSMGRSYSGFKGILCFDFSTETFRSLSYPDAGRFKQGLQLSIVSDKIACLFSDDYLYRRIQIWVFNEYGTVNESWAKLYEVDPYSTIDTRMHLVWHSMNGKYLFFKKWEQICRYNVVTKELKNVPTLEKYHEIFKDCPPPDPAKYHFFYYAVVEFKESLVSVAGGNDAALICVNNNSRKKRNSEEKEEEKKTNVIRVVTKMLRNNSRKKRNSEENKPCL